jgi:hypothetical protein
MNTFFFIIKKIFDFQNDSQNLQNIDFNQTNQISSQKNIWSLQSIIFYMLYKQDYSITNKYGYFKKTLENIFLQSKDRENFINNFYKIQKTYLAFSKLAQIYIFKKAKVMVDNDLSMNPINLKSRYTFCLIQQNNKYLFNVMDLINIINTNLTNSPIFFLEPLISNKAKPMVFVLISKPRIFGLFLNFTSVIII